MCMTKIRFWCIESKGDRAENTAMANPETIESRMTVRTRTRRLYRWTKGTAKGRMYAPLTATILAMICSAGASLPIRPVLRNNFRISHSYSFNQTDQRYEDVQHSTREGRPADQRTELAEGISPERDVVARRGQESVE